MRFRTRVFLSAFGVASVSVLLAAAMASWSLERQMLASIERGLLSEARLAGELLSHQVQTTTPTELDAEADALGRSISARVTLIDQDGRVRGDSQLDPGGVAAVESHAQRPEIAAARAHGEGVARRYSTTINVDMLYVAVRVHHPNIAFVRLALPLTAIQEQLAAVRHSALLAVLASFAGAAVLAWVVSSLLSRRVRAIAQLAEQFAAGDLSRQARTYGDDEIGHVARVLDDSVHELGRRLADLARDRARMQAILSGMVEGVLVVNDEGLLRLANDAARRMLHLEDAALGRHYLELIRDPGIAERIADALKGRSREGTELSLNRDPGLIYVARAAPVASPGGTGAVLVLHDITDLRKADQIRRDFVANVSHELRTPLTAIRGYTEALLDSSLAPGSDARGFVEIIARHAARMERLVKDLLRLARLDAGQERLDVTTCNLRALCADVTTELASAREARRQQIQIAIPPGAEAVVADAAKLHDTLRNLIHNAINYGAEGSAIEVTARRDPRTVSISIADRGPGIPEADLGRVFERFYRVDKARSRDPGGTGLGLAIVKHLVGLHGGDVRAANREGGGAVFTITLPQPAVEG